MNGCLLLFVNGFHFGQRKYMKQLLLDALSHLDTGDEMIQRVLSRTFPYGLLSCGNMFSSWLRVCECACLSAYLAVEVRGVYTGFDDIQ